MSARIDTIEPGEYARWVRNRCNHHLWGEPTGLQCTSTGQGHTHVYTSAGGDLTGQEHKDGADE